MEHWPADLSVSSSHSGEHKSLRGTKPLQTVSGNRQAYALDCHAGLENQGPPDLYHTNSSCTETKQSSDTFPVPATLESNDTRAGIRHLHHRHHRRHRRYFPPTGIEHLDRGYLCSKPYLQYRARQPKDLGPDNKRIWSDDVEEAFQEALFEIRPMGKGKRPQHGKSNGRNELIAEYIFRKTGERRDRKQVSSHIQVLKKLLVGIPSWRKLNEVSNVADAQTANRGFYENSIARKVEQKQRRLSVQHSSHGDRGYRVHSDNLPPPSQTLGSNGGAFSEKRVLGVNFEMWMSPNQSNMDRRLHDFTSLQTARDLPRAYPIPLESLRNWRSLYPCLGATLDGKDDNPRFDIVMVETSYKMMSEFPPPKATLGLRFELDIGRRSHGELFDWTCTTRIYQNGAPVKEASHYRLEAKWGMVTPPFDSMWWAETFIDKVEQKKQAEETGKREVYHATQERVHDFFAQLTAVHEIRARSEGGSGFQDPRSPRELVAVVLWKFSTAPETFVGTTSWQRLLPPPARTTTNSPSSQQEMAQPALAMDTIVEGLHHPMDLGDDRDLAGGGPEAGGQDYNAALSDTGAQLDHVDFEVAFKQEDIANFAAMQPSFMPSSHGEHDNHSFQMLDHFDYDIQLHGFSTPSHHDFYPAVSNNLFETDHVGQTNLLEPPAPHPQGPVGEMHHEFDDAIDIPAERRPLVNFDHSTHNMLQAQLEESELNGTEREGEDETLRAALAAASAMSDLGNVETKLPLHCLSQFESKQEPASALGSDVPLQRPQILTHASFTSHASYTSHHEHDASFDARINSNAHDTNHMVTDFRGHEYIPTSSPEIRRLLDIQDHSFIKDDHQQHHSSQTKQEVESGLGGSFVLVESDETGGAARGNDVVGC